MQLTQLHHYAQIIKLFCVEKKGVLTVVNVRLPDFNFRIGKKGVRLSIFTELFNMFFLVFA